MNTTPVPPVPSREAVEFSCRVVRETAQHLTAQGSTEAKNLFGEVEHNLRTLLAEVERLTGIVNANATAAVLVAEEANRLREIITDRGAKLVSITTENCELRRGAEHDKRTVAEQGAALAELNKAIDYCLMPGIASQLRKYASAQSQGGSQTKEG